MNKNIFQTPRSIEHRYGRSIGRLLFPLLGELRKAHSVEAALDIIRRFARSPTFKRAAYGVVKSMMTHLAVANQQTWRIAAMKGSRGRAIFQALRKELSNTTLYHDIVKANAQYITTVPENIAERLTVRMAKGYEAGRRPEDLMQEVLSEWPSQATNSVPTLRKRELIS